MNRKISTSSAIIVITLWIFLLGGISVWQYLGIPKGERIIPEPVKNFTIIVLPDTQKYSQKYPHIFTSQTEWIVSQLKSRNIVFVTHEGDIVEIWNSDKEWENANASMGLLDDKVAYGVLPGNHDMSPARGTIYYNQYFSVSRYAGYSWYGGSYPSEENDNNYQLFSAGGEDFLILHLEFCPTLDVISWAERVLKSHPKRKTIVTTHGYLGGNGERHVHVSADKKGGCTEAANNTQYVWDELIYPNPDIFLVLSGHVHEEARRTDKNIAGKPVYQLLADYQTRDNGGNGWLRIMEFAPKEDKIYIKTYSPYLNQYETDANSQFILNYDMIGY